MSKSNWQVEVGEANGVAGKAVFSPCRQYRYALTRKWSDDPLQAFVLLNPSTADAKVLDPTLRRCQRFARDWGAGGFLILNAFALRSTDPKALLHHPSPVGHDNDLFIETYLWLPWVRREVVVGWGSHSMVRSRASGVLGMISGRGCTPITLGVTKGGFPRHPLYVRADTRPEPYLSNT